MKRLAMVTIGCLFIGGASLLAGQPGGKHGKRHGNDRRSDNHGQVNGIFSTGDVQIIRDYYAPRYRRLPPGLQKKYERTGTLPPGWQKKVEPFPVALERRLIVLPPGYHRGVIDRQAVIYNPRGLIIDAMIIF
jgi:hypothetical protein